MIGGQVGFASMRAQRRVSFRRISDR